MYIETGQWSEEESSFYLFCSISIARWVEPKNILEKTILLRTLMSSAGAMMCMCRWETLWMGQWKPVMTLDMSPPQARRTPRPTSSISFTKGMSSRPRALMSTICSCQYKVVRNVRWHETWWQPWWWQGSGAEQLGFCLWRQAASRPKQSSCHTVTRSPVPLCLPHVGCWPQLSCWQSYKIYNCSHSYFYSASSKLRNC